MANTINQDDSINIVLIQHEFGLFAKQEQAFLQFVSKLSVPLVIAFHTVLPVPDERLKSIIQSVAAVCHSIIVMTNTSAEILKNDYQISEEKISVIAHGTHLVPHLSEIYLKEKYDLKNRKVLSTFGLLSSGKGIKTTLKALPAIINESPEVIFLVIGKTHPEVVKSEGEKYREMLERLVAKLNLQDHVRFINKYVPLPELLEYLQLTDIYLFTSNDPNQAVSGTFVYAMSCACPIISTPIPHAQEILTKDTGIIFDFRNSEQLADAVTLLLKDDSKRKEMSINTLQKIVLSAWENSAVAHALLLDPFTTDTIPLKFNDPVIKLDHLKRMTTDIGIVQFSKINQPDLSTGYTLDDNARAMIAMSMYYQSTGDKECVSYIQKYLQFVKYCQLPEGGFLNYTDQNNQFTRQNNAVNLDDSNGRAIWALGYLCSLSDILPADIVSEANEIIKAAFQCVESMHSTRAMAFAIKGIYYYHQTMASPENLVLIKSLASRLVEMYKHESEKGWEWFESYLTYANSVLSEALLCAWLSTRDVTYKNIAVKSFNFLLTQIFNENGIEVISNINWLQKGEKQGGFGEQPIDVAYTILALDKFHEAFKDEKYDEKIKIAFNWFLGNNRLHQIIYNPCTGGCYDGLEEFNVNLNQGAESTVSYLMARLTIEKYIGSDNRLSESFSNEVKTHNGQRKPIFLTTYKKESEKNISMSSPLHLE
ncbi:MAG: glycosyltransferase [Bacteroidetes bacterium]|nr:glycosyltransferase [Bacteroidota bacterium]